jgi:hypothetical protein
MKSILISTLISIPIVVAALSTVNHGAQESRKDQIGYSIAADLQKAFGGELTKENGHLVLTIDAKQFGK